MRRTRGFPRARWIVGAGHALDALFYPALCPVCGQDLFDDLALGRSFRDPRSAGVHPACLVLLGPRPRLVVRAGPVVEGVAVHALLEDGPQWFAVLHRIKYAGEFVLVRSCARWLADAVRAGGGLGPRALLVPVPDDPARRRARGFSPVGMLARELGSMLAVEVHAGLLRRARSVPSQTQLRDDDARASNLVGVLRTGDLASIAPDRTLILVEDQVTSGATVAACLARLGARGHRIAVVALARAARTPERVHP